MSSRTTAVATALAAGALVGVGAGPGAVAQAAPACPTLQPTKLTATPSTVPGRAIVAWRAPRHPRAKLAYRVLRDGVVVGQTRGRRMSVAVVPGTTPKVTVVAVLGGRVTACRATIVVRAAASSTRTGAVVGLAARPARRNRARLSWDAQTGAAGGYRIFRDGRAVTVVRSTTLTVRLPRRAARYQVAALDGRGRRGPMSSVVTLRLGHAAPTAPTGAAAQLHDDGVTLSWGASRAFGGRIGAYRVLRDGRTVGAVSGLSTTVTRPALGRSATYRLVAVDRAGWASEASDPVTVTGEHRAPSVPGAPRASGVSDTALSLDWAAAQAGPGTTLRGYRLLRDGVVVAQVTGEHAEVGNLAAASEHDWAVAAVDSTGALSQPSPATRVRQADPPPTGGAAQAFLLASTDASYEAFRTYYGRLGVVYPTFYDCVRGSAAITGNDNADIIRFGQARKVKMLPRFNCQDTATNHKILSDPATREAWLSGMVRRAVELGYDGVNLDLEAVAAADRDLLTSFVAELADRLHANGKLLSQAVSAKTEDVPNHPRSTAFDYLQLQRSVDWLFVMGWGIHYATSAPGPQDDLPWVTKVMDYVATMPLRQKFVMGTMVYGMDWPAGGGMLHPAEGFHYPQVAEISARYGAQPVYDAAVGSWHLAYTDDAGVPHDAWYPDAQTVGDRVAMARARGLGVGFWRLGQEDDRLWTDPRLPTIG